MTPKWNRYCALILALMSPCLAETATVTQQEVRPGIVVRLYDYTEVRAETLDGAKRQAQRILFAAGIEIDWLDRSPSPAQMGQHPACALSRTPRPLNLNILSREMAERIPRPPDSFGFARLSDRGESTFHASVFFDRVQWLAKLRIGSLASILGHVLAHEIGHLLLVERGHSPSGIMRAPWARPELQLVAAERLLFTDEEARRMRSNVLERLQTGDAP